MTDEEREKERVRELTAEYLAALRDGIAERERLIDNLSLLTEKSEGRIDSTNQMICKLSDVLDRISNNNLQRIEKLVAERDNACTMLASLTKSFDALSSSVASLEEAIRREKDRNDRIERAFLDLVAKVAHPAINNHVTARQNNIPKDIKDEDL